MTSLQMHERLRCMSETIKIEPLLTAAQHLEEELQRFGRLVEAACRGHIGSQKDIERTAKAIQDATAAVSQIDARAQALTRSLQKAQMAQQAPIDRLRDRAELLRQRHEEHEGLKARFSDLTAEAAALAQITQPLAEVSALEVDVATPIATLKERLKTARENARSLMQEARTLRFEEMAKEVHRFEQMLGTLERKIVETEESLTAARARVQA